MYPTVCVCSAACLTVVQCCCITSRHVVTTIWVVTWVCMLRGHAAWVEPAFRLHYIVWPCCTVSSAVSTQQCMTVCSFRSLSLCFQFNSVLLLSQPLAHQWYIGGGSNWGHAPQIFRLMVLAPTDFIQLFMLHVVFKHILALVT